MASISYSYTYSFNQSDYNCGQIPGDWEDYSGAYRSLFDANLNCVTQLIESKSGELPKEVMDKLYQLYQEYRDAILEAKVNLNLLIDELYSKPEGSNCFNKTLQTNYLSSFDIVKNLLLEINLLITTGGDAIGYNLNVGVDTKVVYPTSGSTKTTHCTSVYMKQMDFGSEFIGSVSIMGTESEGSTWAPAAPPRDGEWIRR